MQEAMKTLHDNNMWDDVGYPELKRLAQQVGLQYKIYERDAMVWFVLQNTKGVRSCVRREKVKTIMHKHGEQDQAVKSLSYYETFGINSYCYLTFVGYLGIFTHDQ